MATPEGLIKVLGGSVVLKQRVRTVQDLDRLAQDGLPFQALEQVMGRFRLGRLEVKKFSHCHHAPLRDEKKQPA